MKGTGPKAQYLCGYCNLPVVRHHGAGAAFVEMVPGPDGTMKKQLWHARRCWPRERTRRKKLRRKEDKIDRKRNAVDIELDTAHRILKEMEARMPDNNDTTVPPPIPPESPASVEIIPGPELPAEIGMGAQQKRGLGATLFKIMDSIPTGQPWTADEIVDRLKATGLVTTRATIGTLIYTYTRTRRQTEEVGRVGGRTPTGLLKICKFTADAPGEPPKIVSAPMSMRQARVHEPVVVQNDAPPATSRHAAKPAPAPGLTIAEVTRAFNDFQAFMLEAIQDFRSELLKKIR